MGWLEWEEEAEAHIRASRFPHAVRAYQAALTEAPDDPDLLAKLADAYRLNREFNQAFNFFSKAAALYEREGEAITALRMLQEANAVAPLTPAVLSRIVRLARGLDKPRALESAMRQLEKLARCSDPVRVAAALDVLVGVHPDDEQLAERWALALIDADRATDAVRAFQDIVQRFSPRRADFVRLANHAAQRALESPELGAGLAALLVRQSSTRDAVALLVPYYERFPTHVGVLEALVPALEGIGATQKIIPARIELVKARVKAAQPDATRRDVEALVALAPEDPVVLEVGAHAHAVFGLASDSAQLWRRLALIRDAEGQRFHRDRAILEALKLAPHDEGALELGVQALAQAGRVQESRQLELRLDEIRSGTHQAQRADDVSVTPYIEEDETEALLDGGEAWDAAAVESPAKRARC